MIRSKLTIARHRRWIAGFCRAAPLAIMAAAFLAASGTPAEADFRVCNATSSRIGIAVGYKGQEGWVTEGWWNLDSNMCETIMRGQLVARYFYVYGIDYDHGGEWTGEAFMCTRDEMFTIEGIEECEERGFLRTGFFEIDTREQTSWTVQLTDPTLSDGAER